MKTKKKKISEGEFVETLLRHGKELFITEDINKLFFRGKAKPGQVADFLFTMSGKGWIKNLEKGKYILQRVSGDLHSNNFLIGMQLISPAAISYWSALNYYGLTNQLPHTVFIQTIKRKQSKVIDGVLYKFITLSKWKYFGIRKEWLRKGEIRHLYFNITDPEKTIVDCFDYPEYCGGIQESALGLISGKNLDLDKIFHYAVKMKNTAILKRIGFIAELFGVDFLIEKILANRKIFSSRFSLLDTNSADYGKYNRKWLLRINTDIENLKRILET